MKKRILSLIMAVGLMIGCMPMNVSAAKKSEGVFKEFITVEGTKLMDGEEELKFVSLNYPQATSDNEWEHANAMKTIKAMGGNVTRTYTIPVANGFNGNKAYVTGVDENGKLTFNEDALNELDDVLAQANKYGVRVIIPLVDHWHWIGGMDGYVWLAGESDGKAPSNSGFQSWAWNFYSSEKCRDYFKQMISHLLERKNTVTGVKYKDDKAILCWETANEAGGNPSNQKAYDDVLSDWTIDVTNHIKKCDKNHLVLDGRMSTTEQSRSEDNPADILGAHFYEGNYATRCADETKQAHEAGKPFILGEFGGKVEAQPCIDVFQKGLENDTNGIMMWSLRAHKDGYGYYFHDEDGYWASYHWPGFEAGDYYGETEILRAIYAYAQIANGKADNYEEAKNIAIPAPEQEECPVLYSAGSEFEHDKSFEDGSVGDIKWRGVVGGAWYEIQRADGKVTDADADEADWKVIADEKDYVYDSGRNWEDKKHDCIAGYHDQTAIDGKTYSYRLRACNESGVGLWSNIVTVKDTKHVVEDDLDLIAVSAKDANPTEIRNTYSYSHSANVTQSGSTITNSSEKAGYIEYKAIIPLDVLMIEAVSEMEEENQPKVYVSSNGISYEPVAVEHENGTKLFTAKVDEDAYYCRIYLAGNNRCKLDKIKLVYKNDGKHYLEDDDNIEFASNVVIQDKDFSSKENAHFVYANEDYIIYKTADDINAIRVKAEDGVKVEYSYDGIDYVNLQAKASNGRQVFTSFNLEDSIRVVKISFENKEALKSVELSSGKNSIPSSESAPSNILEDGEYYFGDTKALENQYEITCSEDSMIFEKALEGRNYSGYDSIYSWAKGQDCDIKLSLVDESGESFTTDKIAISKDGEFGKSPLGNIDLKHVDKLRFILTPKDGKEIKSGRVSLNKDNKYTGNYGVAFKYETKDGESNTVYVDCVYANSSTKVDDFEGYGGSNSLLNTSYNKNSNGGAFELSLESEDVKEGSYAMRIDYDYQGKGYAGAEKKMNLLNLDGYEGFYMLLYSDGSGNDLKLQVETDVSTFAYTGYLSKEGWLECFLPFSGFKECDWAGSGHELDSSNNLKSVAIYTDQLGKVEKGTIFVDDIKGSNRVENADDLQAKKEEQPADNNHESDEDLSNVVFSWDFAEDGTEGWNFDGFSPWLENGNLCAWSQDEYQAEFSYKVEEIPNGTYTLQNDIKVKSNMRNVQMSIASGEAEVKSDAIDTADVLTQDYLLDGRLEVTDNTVTIKYYLDCPKDENGATFIVGDIKLICVKEATEEEPEEEEPEVEEPEVEEPSKEEDSEEKVEKPNTEEQEKDSESKEDAASSEQIHNEPSHTEVHNTAPYVIDTAESTPTTPQLKPSAEVKPEQTEEVKTEIATAQTNSTTKSVSKNTVTIQDETTPTSANEDITSVEAETEVEVSPTEDEQPEDIQTEELNMETEENQETEVSTEWVLYVVAIGFVISMGVGIVLWRRKHI